MRLDHIAYRVKDRKEAVHFFKIALGYDIDPDLREGFDIQFEDSTKARCYVLIPPESNSDNQKHESYGMLESALHAPPEIFVSEGSDNSIVAEWVEKNGSGIHHMAYEVNNVKEKMEQWSRNGIEFMTDEPLTCPGLVQIFTKPNSVTGIIYELIERTDKGFCQDNVKNLMESTREGN